MQRKKQELIDRLTNQRNDVEYRTVKAGVDLQQERLDRSVDKAKYELRKREAANIRRMISMRKPIDFQADQFVRRSRIRELDDLRGRHADVDSDMWKVRLPEWSETREESIREAMDALRTEVNQVKNPNVRDTLDDELGALQTIVGA